MNGAPLRAVPSSTHLALPSNPFPPSADPSLETGFEQRAPAANEDVELQPLFERTLSHTSLSEQDIKTPWRKTLYSLLELPSSSSSAFVLHVASTSLIIISVTITVLETLPAFHATPSNIWFGLETALVMLFTVEYIARAIAHSESLSMFFSWAFSFLGIVDLLAFAPYYAEILFQADTTTVFRWSILRTFRLLRMFRAFSHSNTILLTIEVMYVSVHRSADALLALSFFVGMLLIVFSTLLYFAERGTWDPSLEQFLNADGDISQFSSIPTSAWFVITTITTVGYGEIIPRSVLGRLITVPLLMFGLLVIALPSFVLGRHFSVVWDAMKRRAAIKAQADREIRVREGEGREDGAFEEPGTPGTMEGSVLTLEREVKRLTEVVDRQGADLRRLIHVLEARADMERNNE